MKTSKIFLSFWLVLSFCNVFSMDFSSEEVQQLEKEHDDAKSSGDESDFGGEFSDGYGDDWDSISESGSDYTEPGEDFFDEDHTPVSCDSSISGRDDVELAASGLIKKGDLQGFLKYLVNNLEGSLDADLFHSLLISKSTSYEGDKRKNTIGMIANLLELFYGEEAKANFINQLCDVKSGRETIRTTPLILALKLDKLDEAKQLVKEGADVSLCDETSQDAIDVLIKSDSHESSDKSELLDLMVESLMKSDSFADQEERIKFLMTREDCLMSPLVVISDGMRKEPRCVIRFSRMFLL